MTTEEFDHLSHSISADLRSFGYRLTANKADAQDLYQETVMKAYLHRHQYNDLDKFKAWVNTIMYNIFVTQYHKNKRRRKLLENAGESIWYLHRNSYQPDTDTNFSGEEIEKMVSGLGPVCGKTILMYGDGYSYEEISDKLNIPLGTVKSRINFARKKLQSKVSDTYPSPNTYRVA